MLGSVRSTQDVEGEDWSGRDDVRGEERGTVARCDKKCGGCMGINDISQHTNTTQKSVMQKERQNKAKPKM